ncbi:hypothetical protein LUW74_29980 [Actinomadura madurae]|uniref:hypothetical protein n=1 Tax=Actinomadura madurae TaxID=1993 RepID=UPI002025D7EE|nr:hypothetical protein [Actinomadura madurae]URN07141.1 hypothetical protein LUW74_29980 [Actinomadura madurae]
MAEFSQQIFIDQIDRLIQEYETLRKQARHDDLSDLPEESQVIVVRLRAALARLRPADTPYAQEMSAVAHEKPHIRIPVYVGILRALKADMLEGWLEGISELLHAQTFADLLDQSNELLNKAYKDPAAVVAGSTLEAHIRLLCDKYGVSLQQASGNPKKADTMNADLVKAGAYNGLQQKAVTAWLAIRNASAHGEYTKYDQGQVANMLQGVRDFIIRNPA